MNGKERETHVLGEGILALATRLTKWNVAEQDLPSGRFSIRSFRAGGATCLYRSGAGMGYIRRYGRWRPSTFAIYVHFDYNILLNLSTCLRPSEVLTAQVNVRTDRRQNAAIG